MAGLVAGWVLGAGRAARADGAFPDSESVMVPAALPHTIVLGTNFGVVSSDDDGQIWTWSCEQSGDAFASHFQMGAPPLNRLYATALSGSVSLIYSSDGACLWNSSAGAIVGATVTDAFPDPTNANRVFALIAAPLHGTSDGGASVDEAWASSDGGATFDLLLYAAAMGDQLTGVESAVSDPSTLYLSALGSDTSGVRPEMLRSSDGGQSWQPHDLSATLGSGVVNLRIIAVDPRDANRIFLRVSQGAAGDIVAVSTDGGATAAPRLTIAGGVLTAFARVSATGTLIVGGSVAEAPVAFRSTDGGDTFQPLPTPPHLRALAARGGRLYAVADNYADGYAIGTSDDEGMTWQPLMSYASGGSSIAPHAIDAVAACVSTACRSDCLSRASMSQWAPELCSATPPSPSRDAGAVALDGSVDAKTAGRDAVGDGARDDGGPGGVAPSGGCHCQTGATGRAPIGIIALLLSFVLLRRPRR